MEIGIHEIETAMGLVCSAAVFFCAMWIKGVSKDIHDLVARVSEHGERIAKLETRVDSLEEGSQRSR